MTARSCGQILEKNPILVNITVTECKYGLLRSDRSQFSLERECTAFMMRQNNDDIVKQTTALLFIIFYLGSSAITSKAT